MKTSALKVLLIVAMAAFFMSCAKKDDNNNNNRPYYGYGYGGPGGTSVVPGGLFASTAGLVHYSNDLAADFEIDLINSVNGGGAMTGAGGSMQVQAQGVMRVTRQDILCGLMPGDYGIDPGQSFLTVSGPSGFPSLQGNLVMNGPIGQVRLQLTNGVLYDVAPALNGRVSGRPLQYYMGGTLVVQGVNSVYQSPMCANSFWQLAPMI